MTEAERSWPTPEPGCIVTYRGERYEVVTVTDPAVGGYVRAENPDGTVVFPQRELDDDGAVWLIA
jgi:hypothetical protein